MIHFLVSLKSIRWSALQIITAGLLVGGVAPLTASRAIANDYSRCAADLVGLGIDGETAAAACALAFRPTEVSGCVARVAEVSAIAPRDALSACSRDRRPPEVATCVANIHDALPVPDSRAVLTHCHRSLLPVRYSDCVVGLAETGNLSTNESLSRCISAGYRPENVAPTYLPMN